MGSKRHQTLAQAPPLPATYIQPESPGSEDGSSESEGSDGGGGGPEPTTVSLRQQQPQEQQLQQQHHRRKQHRPAEAALPNKQRSKKARRESFVDALSNSAASGSEEDETPSHLQPPRARQQPQPRTTPQLLPPTPHAYEDDQESSSSEGESEGGEGSSSSGSESGSDTELTTPAARGTKQDTVSTATLANLVAASKTSSATIPSTVAKPSRKTASSRANAVPPSSTTVNISHLPPLADEARGGAKVAVEDDGTMKAAARRLAEKVATSPIVDTATAQQPAAQPQVHPAGDSGRSSATPTSGEATTGAATVPPVFAEMLCEIADFTVTLAQKFAQRSGYQWTPSVMKGHHAGATTAAKRQKDPNEPRRPLSSYTLWCEHIRKKVKELHPEKSLRMTELSEMWKTLPPNQKAEWERIAKEKKDDYRTKVEAYRQQLQQQQQQQQQTTGTNTIAKS